MGGHAFHTSTDDGGNQYKWFLENYKPPTSYPKDAINAIVNNNNQPDFRSYGNPQGADFWQIWGKAGLVKREPVVSRQQRRLAKLNSFYQRQFPNSCQMEAFAVEKCNRDMVTQKGAQYGMFQAMIGFQIMGLVVGSPDTLVTLGDLSFSNVKLYISMMGFCLVAVMSCQQVHGALLIGIWQIAICSWMMGICSPPQGVFLMPRFDLAGTIDFSAWMPGSGKLNGMLVGSAVLFFVALFDLAGVQYGLSSLAQLLKDGTVPRSREIFSSAALSTMAGAILGTSPLIIANESSAGIMEGAKTGLSTIVVAILFALSAFISPLLAAIPHLATAAPLVLIGAFMMGPIGSIDWDKLHVALPSFVTCTVVPFTYSIHTGIIAGILMDGILWSITWCRQGCSRVKNNRVDSGLDTPERCPTPPNLTDDVTAAQRRMEDQQNLSAVFRTTSGRSTPDRQRLSRFQSPHAHSTLPSLPGADKDEKAEKLLCDLRNVVSSLPQGAVVEPRDQLLLQALEDYLDLR